MTQGDTRGKKPTSSHHGIIADFHLPKDGRGRRRSQGLRPGILGAVTGLSLTRASLLSKPLTSSLCSLGSFQVLLREHQLSPEASNSLPSKDRGESKKIQGSNTPQPHASSATCWEVTAV